MEALFPGLTIVVDEATRDAAGSVNIPDEIRQRIENCYAFVGDITTIDPEAKVRKTPNPNVTFEVGYAAGFLGWERMVLLANKAYGELADLPFDFDRQRIAQYDWANTATVKKAASASLRTLLVDALKVIIEKNPKRRADMVGQSPENIRRQRDLENIIWALSSFPISVSKTFATTPPDYIDHRSLHYSEALEGVVSNPHFHLYDADLAACFRSLNKWWDRACSFGVRYYDTSNPLVHRFGQPGSHGLSASERKDYRSIVAAKKKMDASVDQILKIVREHYLEVDIEQLSSLALTSWKEFVDEAGFKKAGIV